MCVRIYRWPMDLCCEGFLRSLSTNNVTSVLYPVEEKSSSTSTTSRSGTKCNNGKVFCVAYKSISKDMSLTIFMITHLSLQRWGDNPNTSNYCQLFELHKEVHCQFGPNNSLWVYRVCRVSTCCLRGKTLFDRKEGIYVNRQVIYIYYNKYLYLCKNMYLERISLSWCTCDKLFGNSKLVYM